jgi:ubiquinone biosynthesis protein
MFKVMAISEGLGMRLDPEFQFIPFAKPYLEEYWFARHSPRELGEKVASGLIELTELGLTFPRHLKRLMAQIERGELGTQVEIKGLDKLVSEMQVMVNRLAMSILVGALIVGLSQFMHMVSPDGIVQRYAGQFFGLSFVAATVLGFWLLLNLVRARRG